MGGGRRRSVYIKERQPMDVFMLGIPLIVICSVSSSNAFTSLLGVSGRERRKNT